MKNKSTFISILIVTLLLIVSCSGKLDRQEKPGDPTYKITFTRDGEKFGDVIMITFLDIAPKHCANFDSLVTIGFYDGIVVHRVVPGFMVQMGCPNTKNKPSERDTWGYGDPEQKKVIAEFGDVSHERGIVSAARKSDDVNSASSQFFIMLEDDSDLDGEYSVFGRVISGMDVIDRIANVELMNHPGLDVISMPARDIKIKIKRID